MPLQDLRRGRPLDAVFAEGDDAGTARRRHQRWLAMRTAGLVVLASALFVLVPGAALIACVVLALATMLAVPVVLGIVLRVCRALASGNPALTVLPLALSSLKARRYARWRLPRREQSHFLAASRSAAPATIYSVDCIALRARMRPMLPSGSRIQKTPRQPTTFARPLRIPHQPDIGSRQRSCLSE